MTHILTYVLVVFHTGEQFQLHLQVALSQIRNNRK